MTNHTHFKNTGSLMGGARRPHGRLPDHANFAVEGPRYGPESKGLQHHQASCPSHGFGYAAVLWSIRVQVRTGQQKDDWPPPPGMARAEGFNSGVALAGMDGDQHITPSLAQICSDRDLVTDLPKYRGPPSCGRAVSAPCAAAGRCDDADLQSWRAQVRNPANTSHRCGS